MKSKKMDSNKSRQINNEIIEFFNKKIFKKGLIKGTHEWNDLKGNRYKVTFERIED